MRENSRERRLPSDRSLGRGTQEPSREELENEDPDSFPPVLPPPAGAAQASAKDQGSLVMPPMEVSLWVPRRTEKVESGSGGSREDVPIGTGGMEFRKPGAEFEWPQLGRFP